MPCLMNYKSGEILFAIFPLLCFDFDIGCFLVIAKITVDFKLKRVGKPAFSDPTQSVVWN